MFFRIKSIFISVVIISSCLLGWKFYTYFFDAQIPKIILSGIENDNYYCGNIQCTITSNKKSEMSVWLDKKILIKDFQISTAEQEYPFSIPTRTIANGEHTLKIELSDKTYNKNKTTETIAFYVDNVPLQAAFVRPESEYKVFQGRTLHLQFQVNKKIKQATVQALSNAYECFPESKDSSIYETFIPVPCEEAPNEYLLSIQMEDYVGNKLNLENKFLIVKYPFKKHMLHIKKEKIKKEQEMGKDPITFKEDMLYITEASPKEKLWRGSFCTPIDIARISEEFGTIRITQEKGKYMHKAVDILNEPKSVVWASQDGIVKIKERYIESGNTVVIDHGWGILTMYFHLDEFANIQVGDKIAKGNPVGTIGMTGYATGYHLHWELRVNNIAVDPIQWAKATF